MLCYNCGKDLSKNGNNREHIPPKALFKEIPLDSKQNFITVPACFKCNNEYSPLDEEFRNWIGTMNKKPEFNILSAKTFRAIKRSKSTDRLILNSNGEIKGVKFNLKTIKNFHIKNFKGIFYHEYQFPVPGQYEIFSIIEKDERSLPILNYLKDNFQWKYSGHYNIFRYIIQPYHDDFVKDVDIIPNKNEPIFSIMVYNDQHATLTVAKRIKR